MLRMVFTKTRGSVHHNLKFRVLADTPIIRNFCPVGYSDRLLGYKTQVGERGTQLSQGQKQRIVLARALYRETPILILDEATSALDMETEKKVLQGLRETRQGQTTIVISHRLSAIQDSDHIMVVEDNTVVESGTHETLMARGQAYSRMYQ